MFVCLALIFSGSQVYAQLSKAEKKEWKKKAKQYAKNPASLKEMTEAKQAADNQVTKLNGDLKQMQSTVSDKNARIAELEDQLARMRGDLTSAQSELANLKANPVINPMDFSKGVVFKVQVGAFKNKDLSKYFDNNPNFGGEAAGKDANDPQRITIGVFRDYWEADTFKKYMRDMGVKDAWIVPYNNGQRTELKEVLPGIEFDKNGQPKKPKK
ncbi:MAG: Ezrin/radixin/moesin family protein [Cyclobacteriaceae bacterium]|nr:Ezrin/radixin/moesin family protein [Cyclobacteriaceae bacterium]